jgi:hypothetical protein
MGMFGTIKSCALIAAVVVGSVAVSTQTFAAAGFYDLGPGATVSGLSQDGSVAAGTSGAGYFRWARGAGSINIGGTPPGGGAGGQAALSNDGRYISGTYLNPASALNEMSRYDHNTGQWTPLGGIGGISGTETSSGWGISGDGTSVVGLGWVSAGSANAIQWKSGGSTVGLGSTVTGRSTRANNVNVNGTVVVGWQDNTTGFRQGAVWNNGVQTLIFDTANNAMGEVGDVDAAGVYVAGHGVSANDFNGWRWSAGGGYQDLGRPAGTNATWRGSSTSISDDGSKVVGYYRPFPGPATLGRGFIWIDGVGNTDLNAYIDSFGIAYPAGFVFALPLSISGDGSTIAGLGSGGVGFVVTVPEPASLGWAGLGLAGMAARRRRSR